MSRHRACIGGLRFMKLLMKRYRGVLRVATILLAFGAALATATAAEPRQAELDAVLAKLDRTLLEQNEGDIHAWLDARISATGDFGVYSFGQAKGS